jgi:ribose transport system permease protein
VTATTQETDQSSRTPSRIARGIGPGRVANALSRTTGVVLLAGFIAFFAVTIPGTFLTSATFASIVGDQAVTLVLALGLLVTLAAGQFDLSAAQNLGLCAVVGAQLMVKSQFSPVVAVLITLGCGLLIGLINGLIVTVVGVNSFIATLGMSSVLLALTTLVSSSQFIGPVPVGFSRLAAHAPLAVPIPAVYALVLAVLVWVGLEHTAAGRRTYAVGANQEAARLTGVRTQPYIISSFVITGLLASVAGLLAAAKTGTVAPSLGPAYLLPSFAAVFLGTTQLRVGRLNVWGAVIALCLLATGVKGLQLMGAQLWVTDLFNGVALIGAVGVAVVIGRRKLNT